MRNVTARATARAAGSTTYETGVPCKQGHLSPRATHSGTCVECTRLAAKKWIAQRPEKGAAYTAAYRGRNKEKILEKGRVLQAAKRAADPEKYRALHSAHYRAKVAADAGRTVRTFNVLPIAELVQRLHAQHNGNILYVAGYRTMTTPATFLCAVHNKQIDAHPHNVLRGANPCPRCNHMKSAGEEQVANYLATFTQVDRRNRQLLKPKEVDIYLPENKLAVEYCGMYWHSHGDADEEQRDRHKHYEKFKACAAAGVRLITIYESEWQERAHVIRRLLRSAVGRGRGKVFARKCALRRVEPSQAAAFFEKYHVQGGAGTGTHYGLFWADKLVACMRFTFGGTERGLAAKSRVWSLSRYATRVAVVGGASRLLKAFLADYPGQPVKSFSDNRYFSGGVYEKLGFALEDETPPDYKVWSPKTGLATKAQYQRKWIPRRLEEHGVPDAFDPEADPRTEADMTYLMGARRIYDCGKKRWVLQLASNVSV